MARIIDKSSPAVTNSNEDIMLRDHPMKYIFHPKGAKKLAPTVIFLYLPVSYLPDSCLACLPHQAMKEGSLVCLEIECRD